MRRPRRIGGQGVDRKPPSQRRAQSQRSRAIGLLLALLSLTAIISLVKPSAAAEESTTARPGENVARGKSYRLWPAPDYGLCTDPGDAQQLTDGQSTDGYFWTQTGTVGWQHTGYATVTVDLGRVEPICGVSLTTAAGVAGVTWPMAVQILVSDDGKAFYDAGDVVELDQRVRGGWPEGYAIRRVWTDQLKTRGRFVQFVVIPFAGAPYLFVDEVEVHRGPQELLQASLDRGSATDAAGVYEQGRLARAVRHRWETDLASLKLAIERSELAEPQRGALLERWRHLQVAGREAVQPAPSFRAILPLDERHGQLFQVQAALWKSMQREELTVWAANPWDPLDPFQAPPQSSGGRLAIDAMRGEWRAAAVNLANSTESPLTIRLRFELPPAPERPAAAGTQPPEGSPVASSGGPKNAASFVKVHRVEWTDTAQSVPIAAALPEAESCDGGWQVTVLPGLLRQVWFNFCFTDQTPGQYDGQLVVQAAGQPDQRLPLRLHIRPMEMPARGTLRLGGWSYTDLPSRYGFTSQNRGAFVQHLQQHRVNAPWATSGVMMSFAFDPQDSGQIQLDTETMDQWLDLWPQAEMYHVFLSVAHYSGAIRSTLGGATIDSPEFQQRVGTWISAWVRHLRSRGIGPQRLALLIHDEPHEGSDIGPLLAWARAIQAAEPDVVVWEDPTYADPAAAPAELFTVCDVLCPNRPMWLQRGQAFADFYRQQQQVGRALQFYSCSGPAKLLDPYSYHRLQAWHSWQVGGNGSFFWAFGDSGGASSWNEYFAKSGPYTPLFLDSESVTAGKHMESIRESAQDYEYLVMLREAVRQSEAAGRNDATLRHARELVQNAAARVLDAEGAKDLKWHEPKDRGTADRVRSEILDVLVELAD